MREPSVFWPVITNRNFQILWINQILMQVAIGTLNFSIILLIRQLTGSNTLISLFVLTVIIPTVLFGVLAGVIADSVDRRKVILISEALLILPMFFYLIFAKSIPVLLLISIVFNSISQFFIPGERAAIPMLVPKERLLTANSLFGFTLYGTQFIGFSIAGPLVLRFGYNFIFIAVAVTLLIALSLARFLPPLIPSDKNVKTVGAIKSKTVARIKEGFSFIFSNQQVLGAIVILAGLQGTVGTLAALSTSFIEDALKVRAAEASFTIILPLGLGAVLGSLWVGKFGHKFSRRSLITAGAFGAGFFIILMGLLPIMVAGIVGPEFLQGPIRSLTNLATIPLTTSLSILGLLLGFCDVLVLIPAQTVVSEVTPISIQGRVLSTLLIFVSIMSMLPIILAGGLADIFGVEIVFLILGSVVITSALALSSVPLLRRSILPGIR